MFCLHHILPLVSAVNGNWGQWTAYGACSVTCGVGTHQRTRSCDSPAPSGGGTTCPGDALEAKTCFDVTCYPSILGSLERVGIQHCFPQCSVPLCANRYMYCRTFFYRVPVKSHLYVISELVACAIVYEMQTCSIDFKHICSINPRIVPRDTVVNADGQLLI